MHTTHRGSGATWSRPWSEASELAERPRVVLDLAGVAFLDSTVLGTIVGALRRAREAEGELLVVLPETPARRIFEITGLDQVLSISPSRADALARD